MNVYQLAAWAVIFGLAFLLVGGLLLWAYGTERSLPTASMIGPEAEATNLFHTSLTRWFFMYGVALMTVGAALLLWAGSVSF